MAYIFEMICTPDLGYNMQKTEFENVEAFKNYGVYKKENVVGVDVEGQNFLSLSTCAPTCTTTFATR